MVHKAGILTLMREILRRGSKCPSHSLCRDTIDTASIETASIETAFEMASSTVRYGPGVTGEVGKDAVNFSAKRVLLITDKNVSQIPTFKLALDSLCKNKIEFDVYDQVGIEPTDISMLHAVDYARNKPQPYDLFLAIGGGSTMDTCKVVNLLCADKEASLLDYTNTPIGKGKVVRVSLKPMVAIPTTSGTGSETTGVAIFDLTYLKAKVGIGHRNLRPTLGLIDPNHTLYLPRDVACFSGFDVFCHALESYTALPYYLRSPYPDNPINRPAYQGSNPISDVWALHSLKVIEKYFVRSVNDPSDIEARSNMHLASALAGIGFGNAGVHLCHGMSYPISGLSKRYHPKNNDYKVENLTKKSLIPHGLSVVVTAPAIFKFTSALYPERHIQAAKILDPSFENVCISKEDSGLVLSDVIRKYMNTLSVPDGLNDLGFIEEDITALVEGTLPQERVTKLSPRTFVKEDLHQLFKSSFKIY